MESLVYEDSPLADYLEGMLTYLQYSVLNRNNANSFTDSGEGQGETDWVPQEVDREQQTSSEPPASSFAPRGPPRLQDRLRDKIPAPLRLRGSGKREALAKIQEACSVC